MKRIAFVLVALLVAFAFTTGALAAEKKAAQPKMMKASGAVLAYDPDNPEATFRVLVSPMILWIWIGGGFFLLGGAVAFSTHRRGQLPEK